MLYKTCCKCKQNQKIENFSRNKSTKDGLHYSCKPCKSNTDKNYYSKNKIQHKERVKNRKIKVSNRNKKIIFEYLKTHPCIECGETDPIVLEFDHLKNKKRTISSIGIADNSEKLLKEEIEKCEVRCVKCHRRKTAKDFNYWKVKFINEGL